MADEKLTSMLGMCRRAGKLAMGRDAVQKSIAQGKSHAVIFCSDVSPRLFKELSVSAEKCNSPAEFFKVDLTIDEIHFLTGYKAGVMSVNDVNFANGLRKLISRGEF